MEEELEGVGSFSLLVENDSNLRPLVAKESHFSGLRKGEFGDLARKEGWGRPLLEHGF